MTDRFLPSPELAIDRRLGGEYFEATGDQAKPAEGTMSWTPAVLQYWQAVIRWRWVIAGIIGICLVAGIVLTLLTPPLYTSRTQIEISREQKNVTNVEGVLPQGEGRDDEFYATQYELLKADSLAERVARRLNLGASSAFFVAHGVELPADTPAAGSSALRQRERQAARLLLENIEIAPIRASRLVDIKYTSRAPSMSARIANAWTEEFISANMDRQYSSTADARKFLENRLATLRSRLEQSERDVVTFSSNADIVALDNVRDSDGRTTTQRTLASADLEAINSALISARTDRIAAESRANSATVASSSDVAQNEAVVALRAKRAEALAEHAKLMVRFSPSYPTARALMEQVRALDAAIATESGRATGSRRQAYVEALSREQELQKRVNAMKAELDRQRRASIQFNIFQREADTNRQLYDALLQRYKEIGVAGTVGATNVVVVDNAKVPGAPSSPDMNLYLLIALLIGLALAGATVFTLEQIDEGVRNPDHVRQLGLPLLGNVPLAKDTPLEDLADPKSHVSEAYFSIRSTLAFATNHGFPSSLAVISSQQGEGKSTTALALAEVIGRTGKRVLLIDGDLRSPSIHRLLGLDNTAGFSNLLAGDDEVLAVVRETDRRGLFVLTTGPLPPSPAELLSSDRLSELIVTFLKRFDHIVIDAPPVLGLADAPLTARAVEGVVFVVEVESTPLRGVRSAIQRLRDVGSHVFGVIVTKIDYSRHSYGYGYGYGYGYSSRYGEDNAKESAA